jgi:vanillate O-demethylase monooxygenase subunit
VIEQQGVVWLWPGDPELIGDVAPTPTPELADPDWEHVTGSFTVKANSVLMIENLLDASHFYPLHAKNIGKGADNLVPIQVEEGEIRGCRFVRAIREVNNAKQSADFADLLGYELADSHAMQTMVGPGIVLAERTLWPAGRKGDAGVARQLRNMHILTPIDRRTHVYRWVVNMPKGQMSGRYPKMRAVERAEEVLKQTFAEDLWALEKQQQSSEFPERGFDEMFLRADAALVRARRVLQAIEQRNG